MDDIKITLSKEHLDNQVQQLHEELDYSPEEARSIYNELRNNVENKAIERQYDWSDEVIDSVTNILIATQIQTEDQVTGELPDEFDVFKNIATQV